jgi:competence protein ComEC
VGTGLSILVTGPGFALLYDAGSNDDLSTGEHNRVVDYLKRTVPDLQTLDHVILSHPHRDHVELMADVFAAFEVKDVWNSGAYNDICGYRGLLSAIAAEPDVRYHTALLNYGDEAIELTERCRMPAQTLELVHGARIDAEPIRLGTNASMRFLYVDGSEHSDLNDNSLVLQLKLGSHTVLLMGDAGGGSRKLPSTPPSPDSIEGVLLTCCSADLVSDVLVVGHHGSKTSSRTRFLDAVGAKVFIVSSGPTKYSGTGLPDAEVIEELERRGQVWRTDVDDQACGESAAKVGRTEDGRPGGCTNVVLSLTSQGIRGAIEPVP